MIKYVTSVISYVTNEHVFREECESCVSDVSQCQRFPRESVSQYPSDIECNHVLSQSQFFFFLLRSVVVFCFSHESVGFVSIVIDSY